jgi:hypothetical protein
MSRRAIVSVPLVCDDDTEDDPQASIRGRIQASFTFTSQRDATVVERAGTLAPRFGATTPVASDPLVVAFAAACAHAWREVPAGLHVRASSRAPLVREDTADTALAVAAVVAATTLLALRFTEDDILSVATSLGYDTRLVARAIAQHKLTVRHECNDDLPCTTTVEYASR